MPKYVKTGIVSRAVDYKEADRILTLLTPDAGKLTVTARGCRRTGCKTLCAAQPLCYAQFELYDRVGKAYVAAADVYDNFYGLAEDLRAYGYACALLSLCEAGFTAPGEAAAWRKELPAHDAQLFALLISAFKLLAAGADADAIALFALTHTAKWLGVLPQLAACAGCGRRQVSVFSLPAGGMLCAACNPGIVGVSTPLPAQPLRSLQVMANKRSIAEALSLAGDPWHPKLCKLMLAFLEYHLDVRARGKEYIA